MTIPTNFYTQQASLLPTGLQSLISGGQLVPTANPVIPQQPTVQSQIPSFMQQIPQNWNLAAQQAAPIYQAPPVQAQAAAPAPVQAQTPQYRPALQNPWQTNSINRLSAQ